MISCEVRLLVKKVVAQETLTLLKERSRYELELYQHAVRINEELVEVWRREKELGMNDDKSSVIVATEEKSATVFVQ